MGYIYKIVNDINSKVYVGQTTYTLEDRFKQHLFSARHQAPYKLYRAMNKYGIEHFHIMLIEECPNDELNIKEAYWIGKYNSFNNGYNCTLGGDGVQKYNHNEMLKLWNEGYPLIYIAKKYNAHPDVVGKIIRSFGVTKEEIYHRGTGNNRKVIAQYDKQGNLIKIYPSGSEAARQTGNRQTNISKCCLGKTKTCGGYIWKYIDDKYTQEEKYELLKEYQKKE